MDWAAFSRELTARHTPATHYDIVRDRFAAVRQTGSVTHYIAAFNQLVLQIPDLGTAEQRSTFMRGLKPHIKTQVYLHCRDGEDLETLMSLAEKVDDITFNPHRNRPLATVPSPPSRAPQGPEPMELGSMQHTPTDRLAATSIPRAPLTEQQRAALFANDGCFCCRRPHAGHISRDCPARRNRAPAPNSRSGPNPGRRQGNGPPRR